MGPWQANIYFDFAIIELCQFIHFITSHKHSDKNHLRRKKQQSNSPQVRFYVCDNFMTIKNIFSFFSEMEKVIKESEKFFLRAEPRQHPQESKKRTGKNGMPEQRPGGGDFLSVLNGY